MSDPLADLARLEGIPSAVTAARDAAASVLRERGRRPVPPEVSARALLAGARASAEIEGEQWEPGAVRLSTELIELGERISIAPAQVLARAHSLLAKGMVDDDDLGRVVEGRSDDLSGLSTLLTMPTSAPAVVLAAVAHAEVLRIRPFGAGDGIIARAVEHMVLIHAGIDARAALVPEAGHLAAGGAYQRLFEGYLGGGVNGVRDWILHCCEALARGAEESPLGRARRYRNDQV